MKNYKPIVLQGKYIAPGQCVHCGGMHHGESYAGETEAITDLDRQRKLCRDARLMLRLPDAVEIKVASTEA